MACKGATSRCFDHVVDVGLRRGKAHRWGIVEEQIEIDIASVVARGAGRSAEAHRVEFHQSRERRVDRRSILRRDGHAVDGICDGHFEARVSRLDLHRRIAAHLLAELVV